MMDSELKKHDMKSLYISSSDSLRNRRIIQTIPQGWNDRPPLFMGRDQDGLLKGVSFYWSEKLGASWYYIQRLTCCFSR